MQGCSGSLFSFFRLCGITNLKCCCCISVLCEFLFCCKFKFACLKVGVSNLCMFLFVAVNSNLYVWRLLSFAFLFGLMVCVFVSKNYANCCFAISVATWHKLLLKSQTHLWWDYDWERRHMKSKYDHANTCKPHKRGPHIWRCFFFVFFYLIKFTKM